MSVGAIGGVLPVGLSTAASSTTSSTTSSTGGSSASGPVSLETEVAVRLLGVDRAGLASPGDVGRGDRDHEPTPSSVPVAARAVNPTGARHELALRQITVEGAWVRVERTSGPDGESLIVEASAFRLQLSQLWLGATAPTRVAEADPLAVDLSGAGLRTTGVADGIDFDLTGDGRIERMSNVAGGTHWLIKDRNGDGIVNDGRELFGDQLGHADGIAALAELDSNGDGYIDHTDELWHRLGVWDGNADRTFRTLDEVGIARLGLERQRYGAEVTLGGADRIDDAITVHLHDGTTRSAADLWVKYAV